MSPAQLFNLLYILLGVVGLDAVLLVLIATLLAIGLLKGRGE